MNLEQLLKHFNIENVQYIAEKTYTPEVYVKYINGDTERTGIHSIEVFEHYLRNELFKERNNKLDKI